MPFFSVDARKLQADLGLSADELHEAHMVLINQNLTPGPRQGIVGMIGIGERGQAEAERLGPTVALRDPPPPTSIVATGDNSIFQFAGANSVQNATANWHSADVRQVLNQIEHAIPELAISPEQKTQARGLLESLRHAVSSSLPSAGLAAIAGTLSSLLDSAGSELGKVLIDAISKSSG